MTSAGGSAQREFERRNKLDRERRRSQFRLKLALVLLVPVAVYLGLRYFVTTLPGGSPALDVLPPVIAVLTFLRLLTDWTGPRQTTTAWRKGAEGERLTAGDLEGLPSRFVVMHDLRIPGSRSNIDHLVLGPTGVFTVETKNYSRKLHIDSKGAKAVAGQARNQAETTSALIGVTVTPLVCMRGASVTGSLWFKPRVGGVLFRSSANLNRTITRAKGVLSDAEVERLVERVRAAFRRA